MSIFKLVCVSRRKGVRARTWAVSGALFHVWYTQLSDAWWPIQAGHVTTPFPPPPPVTGCTLLVARSTSGKAYLLIFDSIHHCLVILQAIHGNFTARPTAEST